MSKTIRYLLATGLLIGVVLVVGNMAVGTLSVNSTTTTLTAINTNVQPDTSAQLYNTGVADVGTQSAQGNACPGVDATIAGPVVTGGTTSGNVAYTIDIREPSVNTWNADTIYKAKFSIDGVSTFTGYFNNSTADSLSTEKVKLHVDLEATTPPINDAYYTELTSLAGCAWSLPSYNHSETTSINGTN